MASHHRRRRQQDSRVGMTAVEEEDEEEAETEEATASSPPAAAAAAATAQSVSSVIAGRRGSAFTPAAYAGVHHALFPCRRSHRTNPLRLVERLTKNLVETYRICNPEFKYSEELNPKRFLTSPADGVLNNGHDNLNSDLILNVNYVIFNIETRKRYIVTDILGHGTFGQVAKCWVPESNTLVAVKIIKNQPAYYRQALVEVSILRKLNEEFDPEDKHHIVRMYDCFVFQRHLCISFELLDTNLYELIKINNHSGLSLSIVQLFSRQILCGLVLMKDAGIIHCDLKPENILLCTSVKPEVKIIDFGSACIEERTIYSYIQSRYYRSPEVVLGYQYSTAIDMWSFGCIVAELFLGLPLFPGASEFDLLTRMIRILGVQPPDYVLKDAKNTGKFFKYTGSIRQIDAGDVSTGVRSAYQALTEIEYEAREKKKPVIGKEYFHYMNLDRIIKDYPYRKNMSEEDIIKEGKTRLALTDFLKGLVELDPAKRWSPFQAMKHPFVTGEPFTCPYRPPPETPRVPVAQHFKVDHHPGGGHWFAAGLSPNVSGRNNVIHVSPHVQILPHAHGSSYGSLGSHGSFSDYTGVGSSYGSYGESFNAFAHFSPIVPSGINIHLQSGLPMVGASPDTRRAMIQRSQGLGVSPSGGSFAPLPLGASPSQFTPPNSLSQISGSPGHFGPASPARGNCLGSPLGKGAAVSPFSRRRNWGHSGNMQPQEGTSSSHWQESSINGSASSLGEGNFQVHSGPLNMPSKSDVPIWKQPQGTSVVASDYSSLTSIPNSIPHGSCMPSSQSKGTIKDRLDVALSLPDPADWDPNYSEELLLQDDNPDISCVVSQLSNGLHINQPAVPSDKFIGFGTYKHDFSPSSNKVAQRPGNIQPYSQLEVGSPPLVHDLHAGYGRSLPKPSLFVPHLSQNSPSRFGQQTVQQFNHWGSYAMHARDVPHPKLQPHPVAFSSGGPHSPGNSSCNDIAPWGHRANYSITSMPSSTCERKDYTRIS